MLRSLIWMLLLLACRLPATIAANAANRPNIVFIFADDMGYGDLGCYGAPDVRTPHIDRLAREGVRFTNFYANGPECSPSRTAFLTGRYQQRVGGLECAIGVGNVGRYDDAIRLANRHDLGLPASETTISQLLKRAGYRTAIFGKWHLGYERKFLPDRHGFDQWLGIIGGNADFYRHNEEDGFHGLYLNDRPVHRKGYVTDMITEAAVQFIQQQDEAPFFLYVPYTAPHTPIQAPDDPNPAPVTRENWNVGDRATYAAMIERMDEGVGTILDALGKRGLTGNTVVVFKSDNGGTKLSRNAPFSGTKGTTMEGGIRVPCIARWPGRIPAGSESAQPAMTMDLTASFARIAGVAPPRSREFDGIDVLALVETGQPVLERTLCWRGRRGERTWRAIRDGDLKYVSDTNGDSFSEFLFDLKADPGEKHNLLAERPHDATVLKFMLEGWEKEVRPRR